MSIVINPLQLINANMYFYFDHDLKISTQTKDPHCWDRKFILNPENLIKIRNVYSFMKFSLYRIRYSLNLEKIVELNENFVLE